MTKRALMTYLAMAISCGSGTGTVTMPDAAPGADIGAPDSSSPGPEAFDALVSPDQEGIAPDGSATPDAEEGRPAPRTWTRETVLDGRLIGGTGPTDVWVLGDLGEAWHSGGDGQWTRREPGVGGNLTGIWGTAANDLYISVEAAQVLHWNGQSWEKQTEGFAVGTFLDTIWGAGPKDIYVAGPGLYRSMGDGKWVAQKLVRQVAPIVRLWASGPDDVWALGVGGVLRSKGDGAWRVEETGKATPQAIWGSGPNDVYAVYARSVLHSTGDGRWVEQRLPDSQPDVGGFSDVWGSGPNDVYVVGVSKKELFRSTGNGRWFAEPSPTNNAVRIWGTGPDNVYLLGAAGSVFRSH